MEAQQIQTLTANFEGHAIADHFPGVGKMVELGKGGQLEIGDEHVTINEAVRQTLLGHGIRLESLPAAEDAR